MFGSDLATAGHITAKALYDPAREGLIRQQDRDAAGNDPQRVWGTVSLPANSPFLNLNMHGILFGLPRSHSGPTEPGGGWAPYVSESFAGLVIPPHVKTAADMMRTFPILGFNYMDVLASNPSNFDINTTMTTWGGIGMLPAASPKQIPPGCYLKAVRPPPDHNAADDWESKRFVSTLNPRGKLPVVLEPATQYDGVQFVRDSLATYLNSGAFIQAAPVQLFNQNNSFVGSSSSGASQDVDRALMLQHFIMTSIVVGVRALSDAGVVTINDIGDGAAWQQSFAALNSADWGAAKLDAVSKKLVPAPDEAAKKAAKQAADDRTMDLMQLLGLVSSASGVAGISRAKFNNSLLVARVMGTLFNNVLDSKKQPSFSAAAMMSAAGSAGANGAAAQLKRNVDSAFAHMMMPILDAQAEAQGDVVFFSHTGANQGGMFSGQTTL
jgi:hypothetical protein